MHGLCCLLGVLAIKRKKLFIVINADFSSWLNIKTIVGI